MKLQRKSAESKESGKDIYETEYEGKTFVGTLRECLLFGMGFGCDQAAELRYMMSIKNKAQALKNK